MTTQSEIDMELALVAQLERLGYEAVQLKNEAELVANFKRQLEEHNKLLLSHDEFAQVLNKLNKGDIFDRSKQLRRRIDVDKADGSVLYLELFDTKNWCQNRFQVARQITNKSDTNHSRYDVTLLINGLPLVQIELKARGSDIKSAFDQIVRYRSKSYSTNHGLFDYVQLFIISNGVNTRYFSNNKTLSYQFTFEWADRENQSINRLSDFTEEFLEKCHLAHMIARYVVQHETMRCLMVLRPYQYYAVEQLIKRVHFGRGDGYVWHTTGSGKTLTSFKASQILANDPNVDKILFVVDRRDLDYQTALEFNAFSPDSVDTTDSTKKLVSQLNDPACKLIVTTIQKLNAAITKKRFQTQCQDVADKKVVFIFDECHRSQFGETHQRICDFFTNRQMFGFTGTPIFDANIVNTKFGKKTTEHLFGRPLHRYVITDAIRDRNVLRFSVEYRGSREEIQAGNEPAPEQPDEHISVEDLLKSKVVLESPERVGKIVDDIIQIHPSKTYQQEYTAMLCVAGVDVLQRYYEQLRIRKDAGQHDLRVATIFSCAQGEPEEFSGVSEQDLPNMEDNNIDTERRKFLQSCISDYNAMYGTSYSAYDNKSFYEYYQDLSRRVKRKEVDILLVVNMFLTGFDSPPLNTLYVDKNLKHHGLIQAFSRTNRIYDVKKSHGNIVCYRNLKDATDEALSIFANRNAKASVDQVISTVVMEPYEVIADQFREEVTKLKAMAPRVGDVDKLQTDEEQFEFITKFRDVLRLQNTLKTFSAFGADLESGHLGITEQGLLDYQSKYLDLKEDIEAAARAARKDKQTGEGEPPGGDQEEETTNPFAAILAELDFEVELIKRDEITVGYILKLIEKLKDQPTETKFQAHREMILDTLQSNPELRSKRNLFESFIDKKMTNLQVEEDEDIEGIVVRRFNDYVESERQKAITEVSQEFQADREKLASLYADFVYRGRLPDRKDLLGSLTVKPRIVQRTQVAEDMRSRMTSVAETYEGAVV
mgnify:CR=1 FL=1